WRRRSSPSWPSPVGARAAAGRCAACVDAGQLRESVRMAAPPTPTSVDFHFDVMCPFAYQTSKWIRSVREQTGLTINWRFFSLEEINRVDGKKHPWEREWTYGW